jgi:hypothetical protein
MFYTLSMYISEIVPQHMNIDLITGNPLKIKVRKLNGIGKNRCLYIVNVYIQIDRATKGLYWN